MSEELGLLEEPINERGPAVDVHVGVLLDRRLTPQQKHAYTAIAAYAAEFETNQVRVNVTKLAAAIRISRMGLQRAIKALASIGLITREDVGKDVVIKMNPAEPIYENDEGVKKFLRSANRSGLKIQSLNL